MLAFIIPTLLTPRGALKLARRRIHTQLATHTPINPFGLVVWHFGRDAALPCFGPLFNLVPICSCGSFAGRRVGTNSRLWSRL